MPGKNGRSDPRPSFGLPELLVAHPHLASVLLQGLKSTNIYASSGVIRGIPAEIAAAEMTLCLHMSDHRLDRGAPSELAFNAAEDPALLA